MTDSKLANAPHEESFVTPARGLTSLDQQRPVEVLMMSANT